METHRRFIRVLGITLAVLLISAVIMVGGPGQAEARGQCHQINTTLTSTADFTTFTTVGVIKSGFLKGSTAFTGDGASLAPITSEPSPPVQPLTFSYTGDLVITTRKGTLTTRGVGVFEAVPFGVGSQFDRVIGGTGIFEGAEGHLYYDLVSDETGAVFTNQVTGEVCLE